jgi:hypothetical protein
MFANQVLDRRGRQEWFRKVKNRGAFDTDLKLESNTGQFLPHVKFMRQALSMVHDNMLRA